MGDDGGYSSWKCRPEHRYYYPYERQRDPSLRFSPPVQRKSWRRDDADDAEFDAYCASSARGALFTEGRRSDDQV